jgi:hypothetical protein
MRLIKHNAIENFSLFKKNEKEDLLIQEMSKAFLLYPKATTDILDNCGVQYESKEPQDLSMAIEKHGNNLKMLNKLVRLSFLVNRKGDSNLKGHSRNISYRDVMKEGKPFLKDYQNEMKEATLITRDMMNQEVFSQILGKSVKTYLNMDGGEAKSNTKVTEISISNSGIKIQEKSKNKNWLFITLGLLAIGGGLYWYYKIKK